MSNLSGTIRLTTAQALSAGIQTALYKGDAAYLHIRYAATATPADADLSTTPNDFVGFCANHEETAPTTASSYSWARINSASVQAAVEAFMEAAQASARAAAASAATATQEATDAEQSATDAEAAQVAAQAAQAAAETARNAAQTAQTASETAQAAAEAAQANAKAAESGAEADAGAAAASRTAADAAQAAAETARDAAQAALTASQTAQAAAEAAQSDVTNQATATEAAKTAAQAAQAAAEAAEHAAQAALSAAETAQVSAAQSAQAALASATAAAQSAEQAARSAEAAGSAHPLVNVQPDITGAQSPAAGESFSVVDGVTRNNLGHVEQISTKTITLPATVDIANLRDYDPTNKWGSETGGGAIPNMIDRIFYFKSNQISNADGVFKTGAYGVKNTDTCMPYPAWWYLLVFCKDEANQISVQWAFPVTVESNGELWIRTIRRKDDYYGAWIRVATKPMVDTVADGLEALETVVDGKAPLDHAHPQSDIVDLDVALDGKANAAHTHEATDILNLEASLTGKANISHTHEATDILNLEASLTGKANVSHTHDAGDITNLEASLTGKANVVHTHATSDVTNLDTTLAGKANAAHTHAQADITGLATALAGKAAASHTHSQYLTAHQDISGKANTSQVVPLSATANTNGSFDRGSVTPTGTSKLNYSGYFEATRVYGGYYSDYAEFFDVQGEITPGDVAALDPDSGEIRRCERDASPHVVGVVSNAYFICIGRKEGQANVPIGLAGKLPVKVRGVCRAGDSLVSAGDGFARALRADETPPIGAVLGMALERKATTDPALVQIRRG